MRKEGAVGRYKRATAPLDETARARLWDSAGGEPAEESPDSADELADLVDSFYDVEEDPEARDGRKRRSDGSRLRSWREEGLRGGDWWRSLEAVLAESEGDSMSGRIRATAEGAFEVVGSTKGAKRRVVSLLRKKGLDAGLCKSSWERADRVPGGYHEYIDVIARGGARYIVDINLAAEFEIARPTTDYVMLLRVLPTVFVGSRDLLERVVKLMCAAATESIRGAGMHVPPWRRREYVRAKWFSTYGRTAGGVLAEKGAVWVAGEEAGVSCWWWEAV
ncbi:unnamed protein product [Musa hybrid cultivar]